MVIPEIAPPLKAIVRALLKLLWLALAVRTFALTAIHIPIRPERAEQEAPKIKAMAIWKP